MRAINKQAFDFNMGAVKGTAKGALIGTALGSAFGGIQSFLMPENKNLPQKDRVRNALSDGMRSGLLGAIVGSAVANAPGKDKLPELFAGAVLAKTMDVAASRMVKGIAPQKREEEFLRKKASASISVGAFLDELQKITEAQR